GFVLLVALPSFGALLFIIMKLTAPRYVKTQKSLDTVAEDVMQTLEGTKVIRAFTAEQREQTEFEGDNGDLMDSSIGVGKIAALLNPLTTLVLNFLIIAIVYIGGIRINAGGLSGGELLAFISYVTQMLTTLIVVANMVSMFTRSKASLDRIHEIFEIPVAAEESINPNTFFKNDEIVVEFKNVSFSYNLNSFDLENISFKIKCGESLGIIGATGSGKTTLVNLISKFYLSQSGKIEVLGIDVVKWNKNDLRKQVAVVTQNVQLISGTILENLIMGNENASKEEIEHACIVAQAAEFIENLSGGYNFKVARNGRNLSGGQRQRIAIARALLKNSKLLIFDDSSSALDFSTDAAFREQLQKHFRNTAKIFISQRINNVKNCDSIICLSEGKIAGIGSHTYLLESCTEYSEIASSQSEGGVI
ncbi:MAG: ABC transporter ATP-binding protein, partial [Oscillospiraceae bacterium]